MVYIFSNGIKLFWKKEKLQENKIENYCFVKRLNFEGIILAAMHFMKFILVLCIAK